VSLASGKMGIGNCKKLLLISLILLKFPQFTVITGFSIFEEVPRKLACNFSQLLVIAHPIILTFSLILQRFPMSNDTIGCMKIYLKCIEK
jgi:hypothetical protein